MKSHSPLFLVRVAILAVVYFGVARLGLLLSVVLGDNTLVWPPTGIALAALLLFGPHFWPGIALGAFLASVATGVPLAVACGVSAGNTLEALVAVFLLRRVVGFQNALERLQDVFGLIGLAAGLSTMVSATIDVASLCLGGVAPWDAYGLLWRVWWLGGAMSNLVVAPLILTWGSRPAVSRNLWRIAEAGALLVSVVLVCHLVFGGWSRSALIHYPLDYAVFPFIIWAALRFSQREAMTVTFVISAIALWGTAHGFGPSVRGTAPEKLILLYTFMSVTATTALILAAIVTARKQSEEAQQESEERYRSLFENAYDGIACLTADGIITSVNRGLEAMLGWSREEMIGQSYQKFHTPSSLLAEESRIRRIQAGKQVSSLAKIELVRRDRTVVPVEARTRFIRTPDGKPLGVLAILRDSTERKRAEAELQQAKEAAEAANRAKSEFLATMSHELRTPLGIILGYTDLLLEDTFGRLGEKQTESLHRIDRSARELLELITAVLDLSRLEAGRLPLRLGETPVAGVLQELQAETQRLLEQARLTFVWEVEQSLPVLYTDAGKLKVVLKNLIGNAVKFTKEGRITVAARSHKAGVELSVTDTGVGIPQEALEMIFEPFRQLENSVTHQSAGTGLGLHIVKRLLEVLGGTITVESEVGRGSTFRVWVPQEPENSRA